VLVPVLDRSFELLLSSPCDLLASLSLSLQRLKRLGRAAVCLLLILISDLDAEPIDLPDHQAVQFLKKKKKDAPDQCGFRHLELGEYRFFSALFNCLREGEKESACDEIAGCIATKSQFSLFFN